MISKIKSEVLNTNVDSWEIFYTKSKSRSIEFENNKLKEITSNEGLSYAIRVVNDGRIGFSYSNLIDNARWVVRQAINLCDYSDRVVGFDFPGEDNFEKKNIYYDVMEVENDMLFEVANRYIRDIAIDDSIKVGVSFSISTGSVVVLNSNGLEADYNKSSFSMVVSANIIEEGNFVEVYRYIQDYDINTNMDREVEEIKNMLNVAKRVVDIESGIYDIVLTPMAMSMLLAPLFAPLNGRNVYKGVSILKDKLGSNIVNPSITIVEDATRDDMTGCVPFDDEGKKVKRNILIDKGICNMFYYDLKTAYQAGVSPTGNGYRAGAATSPSPGLSNTEILAGDKSLYDMMQGRVVVIDGFIGAGQSNVVNGEFNVNIGFGYIVEDNKPIGRVKNMMIGGNIFEFLSGDILLSKEQITMGDFKSPYIRVPKVKLSGGR